jgi:hypothetical protein
MWNYNIKGTEINVRNINEGKELVEEIRQLANESGNDLTKGLHDFCFAVEVAYQNYHALEIDNFDIVHEIN